MTLPQQQLHGISAKADENRRKFLEANPPPAPVRSKRSLVYTSGYAPRVREPGEATPNTIDMMRAEVYRPSKHNPSTPTRPNAMDFMDKPSKGLRT